MYVLYYIVIYLDCLCAISFSHGFPYLTHNDITKLLFSIEFCSGQREKTLQ